MAKVIGSVDQRRRPVVRVEGRTDGIPAVVDTGFNGELMLTRPAAHALGVTGVLREADVELGDGSIAHVYEGVATIRWLGEDREVGVLVSDTWLTMGDAPVGLVGTELLSPHLLLVDFAQGTVEIETQ